MSVQKKLAEWHAANLISVETLSEIEQYEAAQPRLSDQLWRYGLTGLAVLCVGLGLAFIIAANWDVIPFAVKLTAHTVFNLILGGSLVYAWYKPNLTRWQREIPLIVLAAAQLSLMALIGQYMNSSAPFEQVLYFWWMLTAPMVLLMGTTVFSALLLFAQTLTVMISYYNLKELNAIHMYTALFLGVYAVGLVRKLAITRPGWSLVFREITFWPIFVFSFIVLCAPKEFKEIAAHMPEMPNMIYLGIITLILAGLRWCRTSYMDQPSCSERNILTLSALSILGLPLLGVQPALMSPHIQLVIFCAYFLVLGWIGYREQKNTWISLAIIALAIRLIVYFSALTQNMLINGVCMIVIGLVALFALRFILKAPKGAVAHV